MKHFLMFFFLMPLISLAQSEDCDDSTKPFKDSLEIAKIVEQQTNCPNKSKLKNLCMMIDSRMKDPKPQGSISYTYQRKILEASCVDIASDSEAVIQQKVSSMWKKLEGDMGCSSLNFDVQKGSYIKYAVNNFFDDFIYDVIRWKVDLNKVDSSDGKTVLDYVKYRMEKSPGSETAKKLKVYYDNLRLAGAKHKSEL